jgi:hypothetical protein
MGTTALSIAAHRRWLAVFVTALCLAFASTHCLAVEFASLHLIPDTAPPSTDALDDQTDSQPDITNPGPDMGDYPNSAATLPRGRAYVEMAPLTLIGATAHTPSAYVWPFLLRYGMNDSVEFRLFGNGLTSVFGSQPSTGISPLAFDMKVHLWDAEVTRLRPAASLEVYIQTEWASPAFQGGTQSSLALNFDFPINKQTNLEWTVSYTGVQDAVVVATGERFTPNYNYLVPTLHRENLDVNQFAVQWSIEQQVTEKFQVFGHGYYNGAILLQQGSGVVVGGGAFYTCSSRLMLFGSCNAGLNDNVPDVAGQLGFAAAF